MSRLRRLVKRYSFVAANGRTITREVVRCPGNCRGYAGFERLPDGRVLIGSHGGGRCGFASCTASGREVELVGDVKR